MSETPTNPAPAGPGDTLPEPTRATAPKKSATRFITPVLALVVALGVGIFGGVLIGQNTAKSSTSAQGGFGNRGNFGGGTGTTEGGTGTGGGFGGGNFTSGTVVSNDNGTLTIKTSDGSTVTVKTTDTTTVTKSSESSVSDLAAGETVTVVGSTTDGSVTATRITEGDTTTGGFPGGGAGGQGGQAPGSNG